MISKPGTRPIRPFSRATEGSWNAHMLAYVASVSDGMSVTLRARNAASGSDSAQLVESAPLTLTTHGISRGLTSIPLTGRSDVAADGRMSRGRPAATEYVNTDSEGVEQSWRFETRPAGRGDLVLRIRAEGMAYLGSTR